jgi:hypothetical protein
MSPADFIVWRNIAIILLIVAALWFLGVVLCRERVKNDLRARSLQPLAVRWRPFGWWGGYYGCCFVVRYVDLSGFVHQARCWTGGVKRGITWYSDEIVPS